MTTPILPNTFTGAQRQQMQAAHVARHDRLWGGRVRRLPLSIPAPPTISEAPDEPPIVEQPTWPALPSRKTGYGIIVEVANSRGFRPSDLTGRSRKQPICMARNEAVFRIVVELGYSYPKAGRCMGNRDHTTAMNSVKSHAKGSPEAAALLQEQYRKEAGRAEAKRDECLAMHFVRGLSLSSISHRLRITTGALAIWINDDLAGRAS